MALAELKEKPTVSESHDKKILNSLPPAEFNKFIANLSALAAEMDELNERFLNSRKRK